MALTKDQVATLITIERFTASISVVGTLILLATFIFIKDFRTLSNTLIFYASFANLFANVAALIGGSALNDVDGALCQFQGFLLEMFMQSDPMWSCAMAVNVYLVFFRRYDAHRLKRLYWVYGVLCYGLPFIPAMFCLFYKTKAKGKIYGNATLWCWINNEWAPIRIYSYYAPIWVAIVAALIIYIRVGVEIFQKRSQLRAISGNDINTGSNARHPEPAFTGLRTTEIEVTTVPFDHKLVDTASPRRHDKPAGHKDNYSITISALDRDRLPPTPRAGLFPRRPSSMDKIKWAYTKCAMLFAISILITWVPASVNRVYGLRYPKHPSFALNVGSAIVLPLQGFWNTVIYFTTSISICKSVWARFRIRKISDHGFREFDADSERRNHQDNRGRGNATVGTESDSTIELSNSRRHQGNITHWV